MSTKTKSMDLKNAPSAKVKSSVTVTANVTNRSRTDCDSGSVTFDNNDDSCTVNFGSIRSLGGSASGSCTLDGYALVAKAQFKGSDGTVWGGIAGDGTAFEAIDINLNDPK